MFEFENDQAVIMGIPQNGGMEILGEIRLREGAENKVGGFDENIISNKTIHDIRKGLIVALHNWSQQGDPHGAGSNIQGALHASQMPYGTCGATQDGLKSPTDNMLHAAEDNSDGPHRTGSFVQDSWVPYGPNTSKNPCDVAMSVAMGNPIETGCRQEGEEVAEKGESEKTPEIMMKVGAGQ